MRGWVEEVGGRKSYLLPTCNHSSFFLEKEGPCGFFFGFFLSFKFLGGG